MLSSYKRKILRHNKIFNFFICFCLIFCVFCIEYVYADSMSREEAIAQRLAPIGKIHLTGGGSMSKKIVVKLAKDAGKKRYHSTCFACHDSGAAGAPIIGDKKAWKVRLAEGINIVYEKAIKGYRSMPAKGGCLSCSDKEIKMAVDYIIKKCS